MDDLTATLLNRINGLARKGLTGDLDEEQRRACLVRITENVKLIKRIEKLENTTEDEVDEEDVSVGIPARASRRQSERAPKQAANG